MNRGNCPAPFVSCQSQTSRMFLRSFPSCIHSPFGSAGPKGPTIGPQPLSRRRAHLVNTASMSSLFNPHACLTIQGQQRGRAHPFLFCSLAEATVVPFLSSPIPGGLILPDDCRWCLLFCSQDDTIRTRQQNVEGLALLDLFQAARHGEKLCPREHGDWSLQRVTFICSNQPNSTLSTL